MDLYKVERNIDNLHYRCFEAFLSDIKWIVHNVKVYHRTSNEFKRLVKIKSEKPMIDF